MSNAIQAVNVYQTAKTFGKVKSRTLLSPSDLMKDDADAETEIVTKSVSEINRIVIHLIRWKE